ncbi:LamG domain-containing protein [Micromonospora auratinigra]|uniref:Concanavalin A-like lectin/glucanases superfamily protein n=1 Tax=Micromonospora auratinigra TaxID=261654 RepID=A0A1A8Z2N4_9ACTN|nr:LamG domain-containing protein [Micromonospora auratinigra]SBT38136.1 Concanavalin A-like lectin/glucanases superfamily protein [Micromonospora auratinigra]
MTTLAALSALAVPQAVGAAPAATPSSPAPAQLSEADALAAAKRMGTPVEATSLKTENSRVLATPRGGLVLESYAVPRWTRDRTTQDWRPIDTRLQKNADGSVAPIATLADLSFSAGGTAPAVRLPVPGGEVSLSWPGTLPAPRIDGDSAVYESVLPDVDLRLRALTDGFTWVLVVKSAQAAANPALDELRFGLGTSGAVTRRARAGGGFEVVDGTGTPVATAGSALMWDSSGLTTPSVAARSRALTAFADQAKHDVVRGAPDLARKAELSTAVRGDDLVIRPDLALLRGSDTSYPVVIDPWTTINKLRWGYTNSTNSTRDDGIPRAGLDPSGDGVFRSYFSFSLTSLSGKTIRSAKFLTEMTHSWACTSTPVNLWRTADLTTTGKQAWGGPSLQLWLEERSGHAHKPSTGAGCSDDPQPDMPMEFSSANLKTDITNNRGQSIYTLGLLTRQSDGSSESTSSWWKKFDASLTKLSIEYNTNPNTPTAAQLTTHANYTSAAQACVTGTSRPMVRSDYPWFKATLTDPDGSNGGSLSGTFSLQKLVSGAWTTVSGWPKTDSGVAPGAKAEVQLTTKTTNGDTYRWQVQTKDTLGGASLASPWCEFYVDYSAPAATPKVTPADGLYLESPPLGTNQDVHGSIGYSGKFTLSANGAADVYDYVYQLDGGPQLTVKAATLGGSATVWVTPNSIGENVLTVRSRDQAGNATEPYDYVFLVDGASAPKAHWAIDEGSGTTFTNKIAGGPSATLTGGGTWADSRVLGTHKTNGKDWAVKFSGSDNRATTATSVVDTTRSFSVSAWVRADATPNGVVVSQPGTNKSPFELQYYASKGQWCFTSYASDVVNGTVTSTPACSTDPVQVGVWTHLTGVYDAGAASKLSIYVNGVRKGVGNTSVAMWASTGPMIIAGAKNGTYTGHFNGAISEVRVWDRVVDPDLDLQPIVEPVLVGGWDMEDFNYDLRQEGDISKYQRPLTLSAAGSVDWADGYDSAGLHFDGVSGSAQTSAPVLRTDQSYTVSAWVRWNGGTGARTVLAQDGTSASGFYVACRNDANGIKWSIMTRSSDSTSSSGRYAVGGTCAMNTWVHLTAVHDVVAGEISLYINGAFSAKSINPAPWQANGALTVGRGKWSGVATDWFNGDIDRVRIWQGALSGPEIQAVFAGA